MTPIPTRSTRFTAWQNVMICGINAALERGLISLKPDGNFWPHAQDQCHRQSRTYSFSFSVEQIPAVCCLHDINHGELSVHVALWPTDDCNKIIGALGAGFHAGEVYAMGWFERKMGAWLQVNEASDRGDGFHCRQQHLERLAAINAMPNGFAPSGRLFP